MCIRKYVYMYTCIYVHAENFGQCNILQQTATHCRTLQNTAEHGNTPDSAPTQAVSTMLSLRGCTLQHSATRHTTLVPRKYAQCWQWLRTAINCHTLQYTATYWSLIQHTATHIYLGSVDNVVAGNGCTLQHTATHCNTLELTAIHCNTHVPGQC